MITIRLNGEPREVPEGSSLADLVAVLTDSPRAVATAVNEEFVPRDARASRVLREHDVVLTFQPITGG